MARITLRDVAKLANVHYATASTVLNGSKGSTSVSEATAKRVAQAAADLGYKVNRSAQQLRTRKSSAVGLLTGDVENPFFARMLSLCSAAIKPSGYDIILVSRHDDEYTDSHLLDSLLGRDLAGLLIWSETPTEVHERIARSGMTNVAVLGMTIPGYDSVGGEMETGLTAAFDHLREQGYRRIAYFAPSHVLNRVGDSRDRIYRSKMAEFGQEEMIITYPGSVSDAGAAHIAAGEIASRPASERPDAMFCFNDMNAFGAMMGLRRAGLSVPGDIALVGCDNLGIAAQLGLTTIDYPLKAMCQQAVERLLGRIGATQFPEPKLTLLPTTLVIRESSVRKNG